MPSDWQKALAVVAHPDDLEYGVAGAIAAWTAQGKEVVQLLATRGEAGIDHLPPEEAGPLREAEQRAGAGEVGVEVVEFLDHPDGMLTDSLDLRRDLAAGIRRHRPEMVLTINYHERWPGGTGWNFADHRVLGRCLLDAVADAGNRWVHPELAEQGLEPWSGVRWVGVGGSPLATHALDVTDVIDAAVASLEAHADYLSALGPEHPMADARGFLTGQAEAVGARFGGGLAVAFELITF
ncbi:MAG: PIG-L family deacetylase [Acidimicrobiia bacterium]|nr:PIG-L family deacetylase [Acidimicrobiia bacterium]